jgi:hypothetical protein
VRRSPGRRTCTSVAPSARLAALDRSQEPRLNAERQDAGFVEKQCSAVRLLEYADPGFDRPCKCAAFVSEQVALEQRVGGRRTRRCHETAISARTGAVQRAGDELLPEPGSPAVSARTCGMSQRIVSNNSCICALRPTMPWNSN